jgi:hypothetical protein
MNPSRQRVVEQALTLLLLIPKISEADSLLTKELVFDALLVVDSRQTQYILHSPTQYRELNPLIQQNSIGKYFLTMALAHATITYILPRKYSERWQVYTILMEGAVIGHNAYIGVKIKW